MSEEAGFIAAIREAPDDPTHRLVFADWLDECGDPRAAYGAPTGGQAWEGEEQAEGHERSGSSGEGAVTALPDILRLLAEADDALTATVIQTAEAMGPYAAAGLSAAWRRWGQDNSGLARKAFAALARLGPHRENIVLLTAALRGWMGRQ